MNSIFLNFVWLEKSIGVSLNYKVKLKFVPLTRYYFWPRVDAWEEIRNDLTLLSLVSENDSIIILNELTDVINYWQESNNKECFSVHLLFFKFNFPFSSFTGHF